VSKRLQVGEPYDWARPGHSEPPQPISPNLDPTHDLVRFAGPAQQAVDHRTMMP